MATRYRRAAWPPIAAPPIVNRSGNKFRAVYRRRALTRMVIGLPTFSIANCRALRAAARRHGSGGTDDLYRDNF